MPRGEIVTYGELAALAGRPGAARAAGTFCAQNRFADLVPCHRVVAAAGLGATARSALEYKRRLLALEGPCPSLRISANELAAIAPRRDCDRLAELSGLFHTAGSVHLLGRGASRVHLDVGELGRRPARASACCARSASRREIRTYPQRAFDRATRYQLHVAGRSDALQVLHEAGVLDARLAPLERPPRACRRAKLLPRRVPARRAARRADR